VRISWSTYEMLDQARSGYCTACECITVPGKATRGDRGSQTVAPLARNWVCPDCSRHTLYGAEAARHEGELQIGT
jgi:RNase P subunit RPR2